MTAENVGINEDINCVGFAQAAIIESLVKTIYFEW